MFKINDIIVKKEKKVNKKLNNHLLNILNPYICIYFIYNAFLYDRM